MYTDKELTALVESVEKEFNAELAKAEADLGSVSASSQETTPAVETKLEKAEKEEAPKAMSSEEKKPKERSDKEDKADEAAEHEPEAGHAKEQDPAHAEDQASEEAKEEHNDAKEDHCDYDDEDMEEMHKMYSSMSKSECKAHHDACRKAMDHHMEKCGEMSMEKSEVIEIKPEQTKPTEEVSLLKSEIEAAKAKNEELKKSFDMVSEILTKLVKKNVPQGKAITSLETIAKSEVSAEEKTFTKSEVTAILNKKDYSKFSKAERDAINDFYVGNGNINSINHLLR